MKQISLELTSEELSALLDALAEAAYAVEERGGDAASQWELHGRFAAFERN